MWLPTFLIRKGIRLIIAREGINGLMNLVARYADRYNVSSGRKYKTTEDEVNHIVRKIPELEPAKDTLVAVVRNIRVKNGLPK